MQELNVDILKRNIRDLMVATNTKQPALADEIGMSQPNLSKCLSLKSKQCFTLSQIYKLAQYFDTSVDALMGGTASTATGPRAIAAFIANLLENEQIEISEITVEEDPPTDSKRKIFDRKLEVAYNGFFLPNYITNEEIRNMFGSGKISDPDCANYKINKFLKDYIALLEMRNTGSLSKESYRTCFHEMLKAVPETVDKKPKLNF